MIDATYIDRCIVRAILPYEAELAQLSPDMRAHVWGLVIIEAMDRRHAAQREALGG
jgi:hypothetical protein